MVSPSSCSQESRHAAYVGVGHRFGEDSGEKMVDWMLKHVPSTPELRIVDSKLPTSPRSLVLTLWIL